MGNFGGYLNETWYAFIVYMFPRRLEVLHLVGDNALISGFGKSCYVTGLAQHLSVTHMKKKKKMHVSTRFILTNIQHKGLFRQATKMPKHPHTKGTQ